MSLLDDLKKEAHLVRLAESDDQLAAHREALYHDRFREPMRLIQRYLSELIEQLKIVDLEVRHGYTLPGIGEVPNLRHADYVVNTDSSDNPTTIRLRFACVSDGEMEFAVMPKSKADETGEFLDAQTMRYAEWPIRDHEQRIIGLNFQMTVRVNVNIVFQADLDLGSIRLFFSNFNGFKLEKSRLQPERVDGEWLDNLGNYMLRKRVNLYDLEMDDSLKASIRKRLQESKRLRQEELEEVIKTEHQEQEEAYRRSLLGKLKSLTERLDR
ncbi:MAG: hypothetical protein KZQ95_13795 [Candidatus Thiodiazotropha sp. (ex Epidulcina cf. delphinae)]|nr:hypothetical protein [Candidatus Thiodiazotropha sp. (ex Epidulcina cf. delphinae)]